MLLYEHDRTKEIVNRLVKSSRVSSTVIILYSAVMSAVLFGILAYLTTSGPVVLGVGAFVGLLFGLLLGFLISMVFNVTLEWMSQLLIAQGEILSQLRKKNKA